MNAVTPMTIETRRAPRDLVSFRASLEGHSAVRGQLLMVDLSPFGFMARTPATLERGEVVTIRLPVIGAVRARVVWALAGRVGAEFIEAIAPAPYAQLLARAPHDRPSWNGY